MKSNGRVLKVGLLLSIVVGAAGAARAETKWQTLPNQPKNGAANAVVEGCHLLTDGTVMCLESGTNKWHRLKPNSAGSYLNGTWDTAGFTIAPMPNGTDTRIEAFNTTTMVGTPCNPCTYAPRFFASAVLASGKVVVIGGEYLAGQTVVGSLGTNGQVQTNIGFLYNPVTDTWGAQLNERNGGLGFGSGNIGDAVGGVLQNGTFVLSNINSGDIEAFDPLAGTFARLNSTGKLDNNDEEGWTLLPDNTFLTVDATLPSIYEIYDARSTANSWTHPGTADPFNIPNMPVNAADTGPGTAGTSEVGPSILRPDGTVVQFSGSLFGQNAVYDSATGTWTHTAAMDFPFDATLNAQYSAADAPAALLPNGNILVMANPVVALRCNPDTTKPPPPPMCGVFNSPSRLYEFSLSTNTLTQVDEASANEAFVDAFEGRMLVLPSGEVLFTTQDRATVQVYTNIGTPQDAWRPVVTTAPANMVRGTTETVAGRLFNGLSQGSNYGDDTESASNYPLVRITNNTSHNVAYVRTHDHSRMGVEAVGSTETITTKIDVPTGLELGASCLQVVTNGIPSACAAVNVVTNHPPVAHCKNVTTPANIIFCMGNVAPASVDNGSTDPDGEALTFSLAPTGPYGLGNTSVTLTVTDPSGASDSCTATVTVVDVTPPTIVAPPAVQVSSCSATTVTTGLPTGSDDCSAALTFTGQVISKNGVTLSPPLPVINGKVVLDKGTYVVRWTASDGPNTSAPVLQTVTVNDPLFKNVQQLANGDMRYSITFPTSQAYVEAFVRQNGTQNVAGSIVGSRVANPDGTFTYSRVVAASQYHAGDVISVRFYSYKTTAPGVFTPGPLEQLWFPDFIYGFGTDCQNGCHPMFTQRANGSVNITETFTAAQTYVEAFVRRNGVQFAAGNIVSPGIRNLDGTYSYSHLLPASNFHAGDLVTYRFYSYIQGQPAVFKPGPTQSTWYPGFTYGQPPKTDCP